MNKNKQTNKQTYKQTKKKREEGNRRTHDTGLYINRDKHIKAGTPDIYITESSSKKKTNLH